MMMMMIIIIIVVNLYMHHKTKFVNFSDLVLCLRVASNIPGTNNSLEKLSDQIKTFHWPIRHSIKTDKTRIRLHYLVKPD